MLATQAVKPTPKIPMTSTFFLVPRFIAHIRGIGRMKIKKSETTFRPPMTTCNS